MPLPPPHPDWPALVVDDDAEVRATVRDALEFEGYAVLEAADGLLALAVVGGVHPCVILLDMRMPVMDGWAFAAAYRDRPGPHAPIVTMTAARDAASWAREIGAADVLAKPFDLDALYAVVERVCG
jgi:CheY-like chemotaxis protein